jgi:uncharacterized cofD-like protein
MTQPGETSGFTLGDHIRAIRRHTGRKFIDWVVLNTGTIAPEMMRRYRTKGAEPVIGDTRELARLGLRCVGADLVDEHAAVRHNSQRLAALLLERFVFRPPLA